MTEPCIDFVQEHKLLEYLTELCPGPYSCSKCENAVTSATGWKPQVSFVFNDFGTHRIVVDIFCGNCVSHD